MPHRIACRIASYGQYTDAAWEHLPRLGIHHVEIPVPPADELEDTRRRLDDHGLRASSLQGECDVSNPDLPELIKPQLDACRKLGAGILFLSASAGQTDLVDVYARLRAAGELADAQGLRLALETHPDLVTNGDVGRVTMRAVHHAGVGINFDTANVHYYNLAADTVEELAKVLDWTVSLHLKDKAGGYQEWNFPALGEGAVDFPEVFRLLDARGFDGPCTMELEGVKGVEYSRADRLDYVARSAAYLREIGALA
ncbi:MAG: sugar phosphate isomerase/epimerase family protein [Phycisphaerae bacterium]